ncbi:MAG: AMP-binding protein [Rhodobacterales bacterium]|nr:AMP-binding protein [Rhodobacterales bacterium]
MTDRFRWHPDARLLDAKGRVVAPLAPGGPLVADGAAGLAQVIGLPAFRLGALDEPPPIPGPVPVFETLTSGSTGAPRRIRRTQASWLASFDVNAGLGIGPGARVAVLGRLIHSLALYGAVEGLHLGAEVHLLDLLRPDRQREAIPARRITHLYVTPAQLRLLGQGDCPDLQMVLVGGSKLDPALRASVQAMAPSARIREFYGAAETSFITMADETTPEGSVGRAYPGVQIALDGDMIWVKSPYLFEGYEGAGGNATWRDGWLSVGEVGRMDGEYLALRGRAGRMVTVADQNVFPEEIEAMMENLPGVTRAAVLPVPDARRGVVLVALVQGDRGSEAATLAALRERLGPLKAPKALIWIMDWPVLASGKSDLKALEAQVTWPV